jgi:hypothetical protein
MLSILLLVALAGAAGVVRSAWRALRSLPRRNEDMVLF